VNTPEQGTAGAMPTRSVANREAETTAPLRCGCYSVLSELLASPHDLDPRASLREKIGVAAGLPYGGALDELLTEFVDVELSTLKREYSGLFEVGDDGPPVPIREDLQTGQRAGTREDLIRFYNFFNYSLDEKHAWAPDHLSVELEFMHFLCYGEASARSDALSYQLAQVDFAERHLVCWVPELAKGVAKVASDSIYRRGIEAVERFLNADYAWQCGTISTHDGRQE